jgi:hypothetical protein
VHAMHDWTLKSILFEWDLARVTFAFESQRAADTKLIAERVLDLHVPQRRDWGRSVSVNKLIGPSDVGNGVRELTIQMQSGDLIRITAGAFSIPTD